MAPRYHAKEIAHRKVALIQIKGEEKFLLSAFAPVFGDGNPTPIARVGRISRRRNPPPRFE
jgi:hypothetical protein